MSTLSHNRANLKHFKKHTLKKWLFSPNTSQEFKQIIVERLNRRAKGGEPFRKRKRNHSVDSMAGLLGSKSRENE